MDNFKDLENGQDYALKIIMQGDRYGLAGCLIHEETMPLVEFWTDGGYFISRYYLETLVTGNRCGLLLDGSQPEFTVCLESMDKVRAFLIAVAKNHGLEISERG